MELKFSQQMIHAIFFDFNGVIIDDERIHLKAYREVLNGEGLDFSDKDYFACLGMDDIAFVQAAYARARKTVTEEKRRELIDREHTLHRQLISEDLPVSPGVVTFVKAAARPARIPGGASSITRHSDARSGSFRFARRASFNKSSARW